jgi:S1-C subfamily serine protease
MTMRREDLGPTAADGPPTLEEALRLPDLGPVEDVRALWDGLAGTAPVEAPPVTPVPTPAAEPVIGIEPEPEQAPVEPGRRSRRAARRQRREGKAQRRSDRLALRRHRILPRTVIGIASMLLFFGLGVGVAGAILYAYYDWRLSENEQRVGELSASLEERLQVANDELQASSAAAVDNIRREARPLRDLLEDTAAVSDLTTALNGSVWFVETLDDNGVASVGSGFIVASDDAQSLLVTSYAAVAASTTQPAPAITVRSGGDEVEAELYNWDAARDLALLIVPRGGLEPVPWAGADGLAHLVGERVYAVEGLGANGVSLSPGFVIDQSTAGIQHTAALGQAFRGGPLVNGAGEIVGIASLSYAPLNFAPGDVTFAVPVQATCERVLSCAGDMPGAGADG